MRLSFFFREVLAGLSTFFTIAYLLILYPQILSEGGWDFGAALTSAVISIVFGTCFLGLYAGYPVMIGPLLSVSGFLVFSVLLEGLATWRQALGLVFWASVILLLLSLLRWRRKLLLQIPDTIKRASSAGIGLFLMAIALTQIDVVEQRGGFYHLGHLGTLPQAIALFGLLLFLLLFWKFPRGMFLLPILVCWLLSLALGLSAWKGLFSLPPSLAPTFLQLDFSAIFEPRLFAVLISILLIAFFDSSATLTTQVRLLGWTEPDGNIRHLQRALLPDGVTSLLASLLGTTSCSFYAESSSGIRAGGRTGLVACTVALLCLLSLFFFPVISSIPLFATTPALFGLGALLASGLFWIKGQDPSESIPFLVTAVSMPLFFSVYWGFSLGFISYVLVKHLAGRRKEIDLLTYCLAALFALHILSIVLYRS